MAARRRKLDPSQVVDLPEVDKVGDVAIRFNPEDSQFYAAVNREVYVEKSLTTIKNRISKTGEPIRVMTVSKVGGHSGYLDSMRIETCTLVGIDRLKRSYGNREVIAYRREDGSRIEDYGTNLLILSDEDLIKQFEALREEDRQIELEEYRRRREVRERWDALRNTIPDERFVTPERLIAWQREAAERKAVESGAVPFQAEEESA